jgi:hypothetical protein
VRRVADTAVALQYGPLLSLEVSAHTTFNTTANAIQRTTYIRHTHTQDCSAALNFGSGCYLR